MGHNRAGDDAVDLDVVFDSMLGEGFGEGDEGDVLTPGGRVHLRCLTVGLDSVLVETDGSRHLLRFTNQQ